jgi:hypothetical protein
MRLNQVTITGVNSAGANVQWLVTDHLGTPRMILDQTGTLVNLKRHDYLPFGEELLAPTGGRSAALGFTSGDGVRQQFTSKERDVETGFDFFGHDTMQAYREGSAVQIHCWQAASVAILRPGIVMFMC